MYRLLKLPHLPVLQSQQEWDILQPHLLQVFPVSAVVSLLLVLLLLLAKRIKSKHGPKGEKPRREKKGKQPETADTPADELDTPISETDMQ